MAKMGFLQNNISNKVEKNDSIIVPKDFTHSIAFGQTGCGKTTSFLYPNLQDRMKHGYGILFIDFKSKEHQAVKYFAKQSNRLEDIIELGVPWGASLNLIEYFNEKQLRVFTEGIVGLNDGQNDYWSQSAVNITISIWQAMQGYLNVLQELKKINNDNNVLDLLHKMQLPLELTFASIAGVVESVGSIAKFVQDMQKLPSKIENILKQTIHSYAKKSSLKNAQQVFLDVVVALSDLKHITLHNLQSLESFKNAQTENKSNAYQTIVLSMATTFSSVANNKMLNDDSNGIDLTKALDDGKIIIINSQQISNVALANIISSVLYQLSRRVTGSRDTIAPVSVFIDECQRVMMPEVDLHADVSREAKVEIMLCTQNYDRMVDALGATKFDALLQNLSHQYHYKNGFNYNDLDVKKLNLFEFYASDGECVCAAQPIFLNKEDLYEAEFDYFHINNIYEQLGVEYMHRDKIIQFNQQLFLKKMIELKDKDGKVSVVKLRDKEKDLDAKKLISRLVNSYEFLNSRSDARMPSI